jgi:SAM-dependent methyltransferase
VDWSKVDTVIDLACGTGQVGTWLHQKGVPRVDGVDLSLEMLRLAQRKGVYQQLIQCDILACPLVTAAYDLAICSLATCHLPDLRPLFREAGRLLRPGGQFIIIDYHPFFLLNGIPTHFDDEQGRPIAIQNYVHLISDYVRNGRQLGWVLEEMEERLVDEDWVAQAPGMGKYLHQPVTFAMVWRVE